MHIRHDNAPEKKILMKITDDSQWKQHITAEKTRKGMPQQNQFTKLGFADIVGKTRAMMVHTNLLEEFEYKLCKQCYLSNL